MAIERRIYRSGGISDRRDIPATLSYKDIIVIFNIAYATARFHAWKHKWSRFRAGRYIYFQGQEVHDSLCTCNGAFHYIVDQEDEWQQ